MILNRHRHPEFPGQFVVWFELFKKGFHLPPGLFPDRIFFTHAPRSADRQVSAVFLHPLHLVALLERSERIAGGDGHLRVVLFQQSLESVISHRDNLLPMRRVDLSPNVD